MPIAFQSRDTDHFSMIFNFMYLVISLIIPLEWVDNNSPFPVVLVINFAFNANGQGSLVIK